MVSPSADHFSARADCYARYRPVYPESLIGWLAEQAPRRTLAWDCATGTGQVAAALAEHFDHVIASDASLPLLAVAPPIPSISYLRSAAEAAALGDGLVDLVTVAEALHWFELDRFFSEVRRVLAAGGLLAVWCYTTPILDGPGGHALSRLLDAVDRYWPEGTSTLWDHYRGVRFPFARIEAPRFAMTASWTPDEMVGHLRTWSGVARAEAATGVDPVAVIEPELRAAWGQAARVVTWPLTVYAGRM